MAYGHLGPIVLPAFTVSARSAAPPAPSANARQIIIETTNNWDSGQGYFLVSINGSVPTPLHIGRPPATGNRAPIKTMFTANRGDNVVFTWMTGGWANEAWLFVHYAHNPARDINDEARTIGAIGVGAAPRDGELRLPFTVE